MALFEGQVAGMAQSIAGDIENIRRKITSDIAVDISITPRGAEVATKELLQNGSRVTYDFDVVDGIARLKKSEIVDKFGREVF